VQSSTLDNSTRQRVEQEIENEFATRRQNADNLLKKGMLVDAQRECRILSELDPNDAELRTLLKDIETRLALKRTLVNDIRNAIAASQFDNAIKVWDGTPPELRDDGLGKQIEQLRIIVVPASKLAEQGDTFSKQGRLEEAIATYEDALKINPSCEQARLGLKDAESKLQRIEYLLKEGYQYNLEQNYSKAIETWKPILNLRPGHAQAIKSIVEAYIQHGQTLRAQGDLDGALALYRGARDTDPTNRTIARMTDEITMLRDKEKQLLDRAQEAVSRGRLGEAIHCWKDIAALNPANRKAQQQIQQIAKKRSGNAVLTFVVVILLAAACIVGYQYWQETSLRNQVDKLIEARNFGEALDVMQKHTFLFFSADIKKRKEVASDEKEIQLAEARAVSDQKGGSDDFKNLAERLAVRNPARSKQLWESALASLAKLYHGQAREALKKENWSEANIQWSRLERAMNDIKARNPELQKAEEEMNGGKHMISNLIEAERHGQSGNSDEAFKKYKIAEKIAQDLNFSETGEYIAQRLKGLKYDPDIYKTSMETGVALLEQASPDLAAASAAFNTALQNHPNDKRALMFLSYINDLKYCDRKGQAMSSDRRPSRNDTSFTWGSDDRRKAFCIDRYEYPNVPNEMPMVEVPFLVASQKCVSEGKKLCTTARWKDACQGVNNAVYPYGKGKEADASACNLDSEGLTPSGSKTKCRNSIGVYDMSGNAAEWTEEVNDGEHAEIVGGSFKEKAVDSGCLSTFKERMQERLPNVGFRCCRDLEMKEK
jgi:tetratricopeptide (TPR) repeat protein